MPLSACHASFCRFTLSPSRRKNKYKSRSPRSPNSRRSAYINQGGTNNSEDMESRAKDFSYTRDQFSSLIHKRKIDAGGYGDVHEVRKHNTC
jgi:hypothetical protein